jgi:serine/threonine protein kinase
MNDLVGREGQQFGNYRLLRTLGQGGFADVYLGEHVYLDTQAAIKVLRTQLASDEMEQFRSEARIVARLVHPHIVRVLEFGVEGATPYLVVDYAPNGTLRKRYPKGSRLPLITVINYVSQLADALQHAHDQKVIHRDVKPENMLIGRRNEILLSDFGIALLIQTSQYHSTQGVQDIAGTVAYMAPEQIQYQASPASDQYALAVVVYEWLSGTRPFQGTFTEIAVKHALATPPPLRELSPSISSEIEAVIMKALSKDPKQRYASIREFAETLEKVARAQLANAAETYIYTGDASPPFEHATPSTSSVMVQESNEQQEPGLSTFVIEEMPSAMEETPSTSTIAVPSTETPSLPSQTRQISRRRAIWGLTGVGVLAILAGGSIPRQRPRL